MKLIEELLAQHRKLQLHDANEAETRLKLIERVIFDVLGWTHDDISVEERVSEDGSTTFADYVIRTAGTSLVIEAKKVGSTFHNLEDKRRRKLGNVFVTGSVGDAIIQARDYCRKLSIPFAAVTNGGEWIVYPATRVDQVPFAQSSAIIFPSLESVLGDDREEFLHLLSRESVVSGSLETELLGKNEDQFGDRRLGNLFTSRGATLRTNALYPLIEDAVVSSFTDSIVDGSPELLDKCYVNTPERRRFDRQIGMHISKRQAIFRKKPVQALDKRDVRKVKNVIEDSAAKTRPLAILILGSVGAGKTTFLHRTHLITCSNMFEESRGEAYPHWVYVDFRGFTAPQHPVEYIYSELRNYMTADWFFSNFEQCIRPAYKDQIRAMKEGPLKLLANDEHKINERVADYLLQESKENQYIDRLLCYATTKVPVFLTIDNVDQFENDALQSEIFADAIALAHRNKLNLVLSLRDATYVKHRTSPTFDAFDFVPINVEPPSIPAVLSKRFFLMEQLLSGRSGEFIAENGMNVQVDDLSVFAEIIRSSVLGTNVGRVIDVLATSDVRLALRMTREFLESGYSNPGRAFTVHKKSGRYVLPPHEALRSIMLGNEPVYTEKMSILGNPFDARLGRTNCQLLRLFVLSAFVTMSSDADFQYISGFNIRDQLMKLGYGEDTTLAILEDLCRLRFVHTAAHGRAEIAANYYPSRLGGYVVKQLIADLTFLEAVMMDTFISDNNVWDKLTQLSEEIDGQRGTIRRLELRFSRLNQFFAFVSSMYTPILDEALRRGLPKEWCGNPLQDIKKTLTRNQEKAMESAIKNYGKNSSQSTSAS